MKTQTQHNIGWFKSAVMATALVLGVAEVVSANPAIRTVSIDPKSDIGRRVGRITHPVTGFWGEAFIIDECHVATNYHVAMGKSKDADGYIEIDEKAGVGYTANFAFALDAVSKKFSRFSKATVVRVGNYNPGSNRGKVGDLSVLRLANCLDKSFTKLKLDRPEAGQTIPQSELTIVKTVNSPDGKIEIIAQEGCRSSVVAPFPGLIMHNCELVDGNSGSMVLIRNGDEVSLAGVNVERNKLPDGTPVGVAVYANVLSDFIDKATDTPVEVAPMAELRIPQSENVTVAGAKPRAVVR